MTRAKKPVDRIAQYRATQRVMNRYLRKEYPELTHTLWHVDKFVPDHCPNCGKKFRTSADYNYLAIAQDGRQYLRGLPYKIIVCNYCGQYTATVPIESRVARSRKVALKLIRQHGFTACFSRLVTRKEFKIELTHGPELHPLGLGLIQAKTKLSLRSRRILARKLEGVARSYTRKLRRLLAMGRRKHLLSVPPLTAGTPATEY